MDLHRLRASIVTFIAPIERRVMVGAAALAAVTLSLVGGPAASDEPRLVATVAANVAVAAAAVTGQKAPESEALVQGSYVGFDTHTYPGTSTMQMWKTAPDAKYSWVGYYLPSPCHADRSWTGKRDTLDAMGWGIAVVYVGQQTWGRTPRVLTAAQQAAIRKKTSCSADLMSAGTGTTDADDATAKAAAEGFPQGTVVFLDLERAEKIPPAMRDYYRAWATRMLAIGKYEPGFYAHEHNAPAVFADVKTVFAAAGDTTTPRFWVAGGKGFDEGRAPQDVGLPFAGMWQGVIDVARSVANLKLPVDISVGAWKSPSERGTAVQ